MRFTCKYGTPAWTHFIFVESKSLAQDSFWKKPLLLTIYIQFPKNMHKIYNTIHRAYNAACIYLFHHLVFSQERLISSCECLLLYGQIFVIFFIVTSFYVILTVSQKKKFLSKTDMVLFSPLTFITCKLFDLKSLKLLSQEYIFQNWRIKTHIRNGGINSLTYLKFQNMDNRSLNSLPLS